MANAEQRELYATLFDLANRYLGELLGELSLAAWFACIGVALRRSERPLGGAFLLTAASTVAISALRPLTPVVAPITDVANVVLPLALLAIAPFMLLPAPAAASAFDDTAGARPRS